MWPNNLYKLGCCCLLTCLHHLSIKTFQVHFLFSAPALKISHSTKKFQFLSVKTMIQIQVVLLLSGCNYPRPSQWTVKGKYVCKYIYTFKHINICIIFIYLHLHLPISSTDFFNSQFCNKVFILIYSLFLFETLFFGKTEVLLLWETKAREKN